MLRSRVIAISLISFALLWGAVFVQMATGNDPVLGDGSFGARSSRDHIDPNARAAEEELVESEEEEEALEDELAAAPVEEEFIEEEPAPVTTSQS